MMEYDGDHGAWRIVENTREQFIEKVSTFIFYKNIIIYFFFMIIETLKLNKHGFQNLEILQFRIIILQRNSSSILR